MSTTDSAHTLISGRHAIGTSGRHPSERVDGMLRNHWSAWAGLCTRGSREFYVRAATTTRTLDPEEPVGYIDTNWE